MKKKKVTAFVIIIAVLCVCIFINMRPDDYYNVGYDNLNIEPEAESVVSSEIYNLKQTKYKVENGVEYAGVLLSTGSFKLLPGDYTITIEYDATNNANFCELYSDKYVASDNAVGKVFVNQKLHSGSSSAEINLTVDENSQISGQDVEIRVVYLGGDLTINRITVEVKQPYLTDSFFVVLLVAAFSLAGVYLYAKDDGIKAKPGHLVLSRFQVYTICLCLAVAVSLPMMREFLVRGHDMRFHLNRINGLAEGLQFGQFPVRINPAYSAGYGYADPIMYPNLFFYIPAFLRVCGVSLFNSLIAFSFLINFATTLISYYCFRRLCRSDMIGIMASALYTFSIYRLVDLYTRSAIGELLSMAFLPFVVLGMYEIVFGIKKECRWLAIGFCGLLGSHILSVEMAAIFCLIFTLMHLKIILKERRALLLVKAAGITVLLNMWFIVPLFMFYGEGFYLFESFVETAAVYLAQIFEPGFRAYGFDQGPERTAGEMPQSIGLTLAFGIALFLLGKWIIGRRKQDDDTEDSRRLDKIGNLCLGLALVAIFITSNLFPWKFVKEIPFIGEILAMVQFPWRYLSIASVLLVPVAAIGVYRFAKNELYKRILTVAAIAVSILAAGPYLADFMLMDPQETIINKHKTYYDATSNVDYFYSGTNGLKLIFRPHTMESQLDISYSGFNKRGTDLIFAYSTETVNDGDYIEVPLYYYPGYTATLDGVELETVRGKNNILRVNLPAGATSGVVRVTYAGLWQFRVGDAVSLISALGLGAFAMTKRIRRRNKTAHPLSKT